MRAYEVEMIRDGKVKYFFIRNMETMEIELLPTRFLTHKTRAQESPNTVGSLARSICYHMNFCDADKWDLQMSARWIMKHNLIIHRFPAMTESGKPYKKSEENAKKQNL